MDYVPSNLSNEEKKDFIFFDENASIIVKNVLNKSPNKNLSEEEIKDNYDIAHYTDLINYIPLKSDNRNIFVQGKQMINHDNGKFYILNPKDSTVPKVSISRDKAREKYIEFFITTKLDPLIKLKNNKIQENEYIEINMKNKDIEKMR